MQKFYISNFIYKHQQMHKSSSWTKLWFKQFKFTNKMCKQIFKTCSCNSFLYFTVLPLEINCNLQHMSLSCSLILHTVLLYCTIPRHGYTQVQDAGRISLSPKLIHCRMNDASLSFLPLNWVFPTKKKYWLHEIDQYAFVHEMKNKINNYDFHQENWQSKTPSQLRLE